MANYHTQWAATFAIAAELSRRQNVVALTLGNAETLDMLCVSPAGSSFKVEAKGSATINFIRTGKRILEATPRLDLFLIIAVLPSGDKEPFRFFVLTHQEACTAHKGYPKTKRNGKPYKSGNEGLKWATIKQHEDRWDKLPP